MPSEDSHFKRPFGVEGEVPNGRPTKAGLLTGDKDWWGAGMDPSPSTLRRSWAMGPRAM